MKPTLREELHWISDKADKGVLVRERVTHSRFESIRFETATVVVPVYVVKSYKHIILCVCASLRLFFQISKPRGKLRVVSTSIQALQKRLNLFPILLPLTSSLTLPYGKFLRLGASAVLQ